MIPASSLLVRALSPYGFGDVIFTTTASYSFMRSGITVDTREFTGALSTTLTWTPAQMQFVRDTFSYISSIVNLQFVERASGTGTIQFGQIPTLGLETAGFAELSGFGETMIVVPSDYIFPVAYNDDNVTIIHEIGHALGLSHPFDGPFSMPGVTHPFDFGTLDLNTHLTTRMSYNAAFAPQHQMLDIWGEPYSFGAVDIAALQLLYGANLTTGLGPTTYGIRPGELITIWDNGGTDTIDFSAAVDPTFIDLRAATLEAEAGGGGFLSFVDIANGTIADGGYTIAYDVVIENAIGGSAQDRMIGNAASNTFTGGRGNDRIDGRGGMDTARFSGDQDSYTLRLSAQNITLQDRQAGRDGTDTLFNIEALRFAGSGTTFDLDKFGGSRMLSEAQMESFIELYIAYFNRAPDAIGLNFWGSAFATGTTFEEMARLFTDQDETRATYAADLSNADFATAVYANVLGREADQEGFEFWVGVLDSGARTRDQFILSVLEGAKTPIVGGSNALRAQQIADQQYLSTKTDIGAYFAVTKGLSDVEDARAAMAAFDGSAGSVTAARNTIDGYYDAALSTTDGAFLLQLVGVIDDPFAGLVG